ncbi:hypothetical protein JOQ06_016923 [Pogonophryne albipinna]|uniref:Receptor ligand binding region domain-containing protein n=1 Tax=Pogonophryne albipinna TaxID=1090488 RepID=A0AAD6FHT7_9TELE|nr:hypothetical protein JOQ06_016923 [Pogonophryne albipinna]
MGAFRETCLFLIWFLSESSSLFSSCKLRKQFNFNEMHKAGDVILGGLFEVHYTSVFHEPTFTSEPNQLSCQGFDPPGFRHAMTMAYAIDEINKNPNLLQNVSLGYSLYDNCATLVIGFSAALSLASGREEQFLLQETCLGTTPVLGIVGDSFSTFSIATSDVIGLFKLPMVSYFATCSCLSDRRRFPSFFRTIPSDAFQVRAMIQIMKHFGWTWAGLLVSDDDYGRHVARSFQSDLTESFGGCLAYSEILPWGDNPAELKRIVHLMKKSTARVVIVFAHRIHMIQLMEEVVTQNITGLQWMASEAWTTAAVLQTPRLMPYLGGTLGIAIRRGEISGLRDFLLKTSPDKSNNHRNRMVSQFWEYTFRCKFAPPPAGWVASGGALCTGQEDLASVETEFLDVSNLRPEYNIYKAVYSLAYALDDMLRCVPGRGPFSGHSCAALQTLEPWQLIHYLEKVNFTTTFGDQVSFDENGDALPIYDIINWQWLPDGKINVQNVGVVKKSASKGEELTLDEENIFWSFVFKQTLSRATAQLKRSSSLFSSCKLRKQFNFNEMHKAGDVILGGLFEVHYTSVFHEPTFTSEPNQLSCQGFDPPGFRHAMTMAYAIDEINKNPNLLQNVSLGYSLYDNCATLVIGFSAALSLASGREEQFLLQETCLGTTPVLGIVGDSFSTFSIATSDVIGLFKLPMVSYFATCSCLSDRRRFPSFFRTIPSDAFQVRAMIQIMKHFGWTWAGLLVSDDDYGRHVARSFQSDLTESIGGCLAYSEILPWGDNPAELKRIVHLMKKSTARVVIVFAHQIHMIQLMEEVVTQNITGLQWMASEAWTTAAVLQTPRLMPYLGGTLGIAIRRGEISGLRDFLLKTSPDKSNNHRNRMVSQFWEYTFRCKFAPPPAGWVASGGALCTGQEDLASVETEFLDVSNLRPEYNIYKAVYSLAYALDDMLRCVPGRGPFSGHSCAALQTLEPWQLIHYLEKVNFTTTFGDQVSFDENGDALPIYDIINWQWLPDGKINVQNVGVVKKSASKGEELTLDEENIFWSFVFKQVLSVAFINKHEYPWCVHYSNEKM